jgi:hypothetical protein
MSGFPDLANLPKEITNIEREEVLINVLSHMYFKRLIESEFEIKDGFIYKHSTALNAKVLLYIPLSKIECIYELYRQNNQKVQYKKILDYYDEDYYPDAKQSYFMFGGSYKVLTKLITKYNDVYNDLIFSPVKHGTHIIQAENHDNFRYYHVSYNYEGIVKQFEPIKFNYKFSRYLKAPSNGFFSICSSLSLCTSNFKGNHRYAFDPYDANVSFVCANTGDIINPETGRRVKTWIMEDLLSFYASWDEIKDKMAKLNLHPTPEIIIKGKYRTSFQLLKNKELNFHILTVSTDYLNYEVYELRFITSGRITKPARPALVYE